MRNDAGTLKKERLDLIAKEIARNLNDDKTKDNLFVDLMVFWVEYNLGLTAKKAEEYIELVCRAHGWTVEGGKIRVVKP